MKTKTLIAAMFAILGCLIFAAKTQAQAIDGYTSIDYDDSTGLVDAYSETSLDYDVACDYEAYVLLQVYNDSTGSLIVNDFDRDYGDIGFISVEDMFYGDADTTYTANGTHRAYALYYDYDYDYDDYNYYEDYGRYRSYYFWYDSWFFGFYEGYGIYEPYYYFFNNPYGFINQRRRTPSVPLGTTHDTAQVSTPSSKPHHVKLVVDQTTGTQCGSDLRQMQLEIHTIRHKIVTGVSVGEAFPNTADTCNSSTVTPSPCAPAEGDGTFQDKTSVGCPFTDSTCGFPSKDVWSWCTSGAPVPIATLRKDVRPHNISINGSEHYTGHPEFFRK